jgi:hypothetical protein
VPRSERFLDECDDPIAGWLDQWEERFDFDLAAVNERPLITARELLPSAPAGSTIAPRGSGDNDRQVEAERL